MKITIDQKQILVSDAGKNIVEIAEENGITITAPCFRNKRQNGCCKACVIEVDGKQRYACGTKPRDDMTVIYNREDLAVLRKERLNKYAQAVLSGNSTNNCCGAGQQNTNADESSCGCSGSSCCN